MFSVDKSSLIDCFIRKLICIDYRKLLKKIACKYYQKKNVET